MRGTAVLACLVVIICGCVCALLVLCTGPATGMGQEVKVKELVENSESYDGQEVIVEGEVVGDLMIRGDEAWITVNDDPYSERSLEEGGDFAGLSNYGIGVWLPRQETEAIRVLGSYKNHGDRVRVRGIFHRVDHSHGGDMDIEGISLQVMKPGYPIRHSFSYWKLALVLALASMAACLAIVWRRRIGKTG